MKKLLKRAIALCVAILLVFGFTGCGGDKTADDGEIPTLLWYVPGDKQADIDAVMAEVNKITEEKIGVRVDLQFIEQASFTERLQMAMSARKEFDLTLTGYVNPFINGVTKGGYYDLTEFIEKDEELKNMLPDYAWRAASYNGAVYAVPNEQIWANSWAYAFRKDLTDKYGFDVSSVKTVDDAVPFFEMVRENDPELIPLYLANGYNLWELDRYERIDLTAGVALNRETGKLEIFTSGDAMKEAAYKKHEWFKKGYLRADIATAQNEAADVKAGRFAAILTNTRPGYEKSLKKAYGFDFDIVQFQKPYTTASSIQATMTAVSATTKHPEKCIELIKLLNTDTELYNLIVSGIEGKHYEFVDKENKIIKYIEGSGYQPKNGWKFGNQFNAFIEEGYNPDSWKETKAFNESAEISILCGMSFTRDNVETELAQLDTVNQKYPFHKGYIDPAEKWDAYVAEVEAAGIQDIYDDFNRQYQEFLNNQK